MSHDIVVKASFIRGGSTIKGCIGIDNGTITAVEECLEGEREYDFSNFMAMPGGVDIHTHMREPGMTQKEDFYTGTMSAAFGGTTTIMDMPNTVPPVTTAALAQSKLDQIVSKANVDFGLIAQLSDIDNLPGLKDMVAGFKLYMSDTTGTDGSINNPLELLLNRDELSGRVVTVHAEDPSLFENDKCLDLHRHNLIRNMKAEQSAVKRILDIDAPVKLNLAHLTTQDCVDMARARRVSFEITPHHALLHDASPIGALGKVNPPLRKRPFSSKLLGILKTGRAIIASDHAPHTLEEKSGSFAEAPSGIPGVETRLPLFMALASKGVLRYSAVQDMCCTLPADLFGLKKGRIEPGYDADFAFFDIDNIVKIQSDMLHSKCGWTPFEGFEAIFPSGVMLRGKMIIRGEKLAMEKSGRNLF